MKTEILVLGSRDVGKTTLVNALAGWDILPQADDTTCFPTADFPQVPFGENHLLTDSPGYDFSPEEYDPRLPEKIRSADKILILLSMGFREDMAQERRLLKKLLAGVKKETLYFVIPYASGNWAEGKVPLLSMKLAAMVGYRLPLGKIFCADAMAGLVAAIEDDADALHASGIARLRARLIK